MTQGPTEQYVTINVRKVFDLVDNVSKDAVVAGKAAAEYVRG